MPGHRESKKPGAFRSTRSMIKKFHNMGLCEREHILSKKMYVIQMRHNLDISKYTIFKIILKEVTYFAIEKQSAKGVMQINNWCNENPVNAQDQTVKGYYLEKNSSNV